MPGLVGWIERAPAGGEAPSAGLPLGGGAAGGVAGGVAGADAGPDGAAAAALAAAAPGARPLLALPGVAIGARERPRGPSVASAACERDLAAALYGHCLDARARRPLDAAALLAGWRDEGPSLLGRLEGAFQGVVVERAAGRAVLFNDRLGTLPWYWARRPATGGLICAPRLRELPGRPARWAPDPAGVVTFLVNGYCLGARTLAEGAAYLTPASLLAVDLRTGELDHRHYWDLRFDPDRRAAPRELARALHESVLDAVDLLAPAGDERCGILLSGGWDCRGLLGGLAALGRRPALAVTNGKDDQTPGTDTALARRLAADLGIPYRFCRRDPALAREHALEGIRLCELISENCPEVFGQHRLPDDLYAGADAVLKGDEIWGWQDAAADRDQAQARVMPNRPPAALGELLASDLAARAAALHAAEVEAVWVGGQRGDWNDRKDYLYLKGRVCRYIFGLGASDEEWVQVRRPFLARGVLDIVSRVPGRLRVQKNLYLEMLRRHQPRLFAYGRNHRSHIADYYVHMAPLVRERALARLAAGEDLGGLLRRDAARRLVEAFQPAPAPDAAPGRLAEWRERRRDAWAWRWHRTAWAQRRQTRAPAARTASARELAFRLFLLLEWFGEP